MITSMDMHRQLDIVSTNDLEKMKVTVIGAGGIGSPTLLALAKMGIENLVVYDDDCVDVHNLPNQMYRVGDLEKSKVTAISDICKDFAGITIETIPEKFGKQNLSGTVVSAVDNMTSRIEIWQKIKYNPNVKAYIDGRMGGQVLHIYTVQPCDPDSVRKYEATLHSESEAVELPCTARAIIYNSLMIASLVANQVKKIARAEPTAREIIFDFQTMILLTEN